MKKLIALLLSLAMLFVFAACGKSEAPDESNSADDFEAITSEELTAEEAVAIFRNAQSCIENWYGVSEENLDIENPIKRYNEMLGYEESYYPIKGEIDTLSEMKALWSKSISEAVVDEILDECYIEENGKLYWCCVPFGIESGYYVGKSELYPNAYGYELIFKDNTGTSCGEIYDTDEEFSYQLIFENGRWVLESVYVYELQFLFEDPEEIY